MRRRLVYIFIISLVYSGCTVIEPFTYTCDYIFKSFFYSRFEKRVSRYIKHNLNIKETDSVFNKDSNNCIDLQEALKIKYDTLYLFYQCFERHITECVGVPFKKNREEQPILSDSDHLMLILKKGNAIVYNEEIPIHSNKAEFFTLDSRMYDNLYYKYSSSKFSVTKSNNAFLLCNVEEETRYLQIETLLTSIINNDCEKLAEFFIFPIHNDYMLSKIANKGKNMSEEISLNDFRQYHSIFFDAVLRQSATSLRLGYGNLRTMQSDTINVRDKTSSVKSILTLKVNYDYIILTLEKDIFSESYRPLSKAIEQYHFSFLNDRLLFTDFIITNSVKDI